MSTINLHAPSTAGTAYELLAEVKQIILDEPGRCFMYDYITVGPGKDPTRRFQNLLASLGRTLPACRTVGCIAGWISLRWEKGDVKDPWTSACQAILGRAWVGYAGIYVREDAPGWDFFDLCHRRLPDEGNYGTPGYARHVADRIDWFLAKHDEYLRSRILPSSVIQ